MNNDQSPENLSPDDLLEETRDQGAAGQEQIRLEEDNDRPAAPPRNPYEPPMPPDHPSTDTGLDSGEVYDKGLEHAARPQAEPYGLPPDPFADANDDELTEEAAGR